VAATSAAKGRRRAPARPRGSLSRDAILDAGLRIAREDDLRRLTMKKLAVELDVTPMALYRHFRNKAELVDGILDRFVRDAAVTAHGAPRGPDTWRDWLRGTFGEMRRALVDTPGVMPFLSTATRFGPAALAVLDETLGVLREAGLDERASVEAFLSLASFTIGAAGLEAAWRGATGEGELGADETRRLTRIAFEASPRAEFPRVVELAGELAAATHAYPFDPGLELILESLERKRGAAPGHPSAST